MHCTSLSCYFEAILSSHKVSIMPFLILQGKEKEECLFVLRKMCCIFHIGNCPSTYITVWKRIIFSYLIKDYSIYSHCKNKITSEYRHSYMSYLQNYCPLSGRNFFLQNCRNVIMLYMETGVYQHVPKSFSVREK